MHKNFKSFLKIFLIIYTILLLSVILIPNITIKNSASTTSASATKVNNIKPQKESVNTVVTNTPLTTPINTQTDIYSKSAANSLLNSSKYSYKKLELKLTPAKVTYIYDGDTIKVKLNNHLYRVRYIGMDTPELKYQHCIANKAKLVNLYLTKNRVVLLAKDVRETDKYGRLLRFVFVKLSDLKKDKHLPKSLQSAIKKSNAKYSSKYGDLLFINQFLVEQGWAKTLTIPPDVKFSNLFHKLEQQARQNKFGIFNPKLCKQQNLKTSNSNTYNKGYYHAYYHAH